MATLQKCDESLKTRSHAARLDTYSALSDHFGINYIVYYDSSRGTPCEIFLEQKLEKNLKDVYCFHLLMRSVTKSMQM